MNKTLTIIVVAVVVIAGFLYFILLKRGSDSDPIKVGAILALSGDAASWGEDELRAVQIAIDEANQNNGINGRKLELIVEDAPATENYQKGITAYRKLVDNDKVSLVIGPTWDNVAQAIAPLADQNKVVVISPDASSGIEAEKDYTYFFQAWTPLSPEMERLARYAKDHELKKLGVIHNTDPFSANIAKAFIDHAENLGIDIRQDIGIADTNLKDFRTYIAKLKNEPIDGLFMEFFDTAYKCPFLKQAKELGFVKPILSGSATQSVDLLNNCASSMEGVLYTYQKQGGKYEALLQKYRERYNSDPATPAIANAYDVTTIVIDLLRSGKTASSELRSGLLSLSNYSGATGENMSFDPKGSLTMPSGSFIVKTVQNGQFVEKEK